MLIYYMNEHEAVIHFNKIPFYFSSHLSILRIVIRWTNLMFLSYSSQSRQFSRAQSMRE